ncbi:MAG TPA: heme-binding protein [Terriglobales bacterium]|nr:heme-binding protein [Terriglobales bacterium]
MKNILTNFYSTASLAIILIFASHAQAQTVEKKTLTLDGAEQIISAAKAEAKKLQAPGGVIAVVDDGGNLMALERLDGTFAAGANISIGKARTAVLFKKPTRVFEELVNSNGKGRTVMTALNDFTPLIGGIPITVAGQIVGGVGVSGAASADQDEQLAIAGSKAFENTPVASYFEKNKVDDAFAKGAVLFDGADGRNYMVHASRREKPGQAEFHSKDADIIYVLQGTATFITGGEIIDGKTTAPDEIRGASIKGGETRKISKGDVIIVPHSTPHQFVEVTDPFLYYVVKVR